MALQEKLMEKVLSRFSRRGEAVEALMALLSHSKDGIYRRLRGDTLLTPDEVLAIARHFGISLDSLVTGESDKIIFSYNLFARKITGFQQYLEQVHQALGNFIRQPETKVYYASQEIPIFIYMLLPELAAFKLYVYGLTAWDLDYLRERPFAMGIVTPQEQEIIRQSARMYTLVNSIDLWNSTIIDNTLNQVEYIAAAGKFEHQEDAFTICDKILEMVRHTRAMAEAGKKFLPGNKPVEKNGDFDLYYNELFSTSNTVLATSKAGDLLFTTFGTPNFLLTTNERLCEQIKGWFSFIISRSTSISFHSGKDRNLYFNRLEKKVEYTRKRLEMLFSGLV